MTDTVEVSERFVTATAILGSQCCGDLIKDASKPGQISHHKTAQPAP
jgi:hypothetical protein